MPDRLTTAHGTYHRMTGHWYALNGRGLHYSYHYLTGGTQ